MLGTNETFLFNEIIFGPIISRRLGNSLGINLLSTKSKICNFDCIYCECGWTGLDKKVKKFNSKEEVIANLESKLQELKNTNFRLDAITFAGNGEPTMHPDFSEIIDKVILLRDNYFPKTKISVLSNASMLNNKNIVTALKKVDQRILKLDAGTELDFKIINKPKSRRTINWVVDHLKYFNGDLIIQSMFLKGQLEDGYFDNTTDENVNAWLKLIAEIKPKLVMIYSIDRATPTKELEKISQEKLNEIGSKVNQLGINTLIT